MRAKYLVEVARTPVLSRDQERELAARSRAGDENAARALVTTNQRFVLKLAQRYRYTGVELSDLVQSGNVGLLEAVRRFDPDRGCRLITYARFWIRSSMRALVRRSQPASEGGEEEPVDPSPLPDETTDRARRRELVRRCLGRARALFDERERVVMERRLLAEEPLSLRALGVELALSGERVRQIEERLLAWLAMLLREQGVDGA